MLYFYNRLYVVIFIDFKLPKSNAWYKDQNEFLLLLNYYYFFYFSALQGFSPNHKITSFAEAKVMTLLSLLDNVPYYLVGCVIQKSILMENIFRETDLFLNFAFLVYIYVPIWIIFKFWRHFFQGLDLPNERMPPRKDAPATPEDSNSAAGRGM